MIIIINFQPNYKLWDQIDFFLRIYKLWDHIGFFGWYNQLLYAYYQLFQGYIIQLSNIFICHEE